VGEAVDLTCDERCCQPGLQGVDVGWSGWKRPGSGQVSMTAEVRRVMVRVLVLLLVVLTGCSAWPHEPAVSPSPSDRIQEIGAAIDAYVAERQYGATRAILVSHRGRLVVER
jgi:hypothetical protein